MHWHFQLSNATIPAITTATTAAIYTTIAYNVL